MDSDKIALIVADVLFVPENPTPEQARKAAGLAASRVAAVYLPDLAAVLDELRKVPEKRDLKTLNEALRAGNLEHDGFGRAFVLACESVQADPGASAAAKAAASTMQATFLPTRAELALDAASEIANARKRAPLVDAHAAALDLIPAADGRTGKDLVVGMHTKAEKRAELLAQRAQTPTSTPGDPALWTRTWGLLTEFRRALAREIKRNDALPRDLETLVFGLMDTYVG